MTPPCCPPSEACCLCAQLASRVSRRPFCTALCVLAQPSICHRLAANLELNLVEEAFAQHRDKRCSDAQADVFGSREVAPGLYIEGQAAAAEQVLAGDEMLHNGPYPLCAACAPQREDTARGCRFCLATRYLAFDSSLACWLGVLPSWQTRSTQTCGSVWLAAALWL